MTPEGFYEMTPSAFNPNSQYRLSVNFLYPNKYDRLQKRTGSFVMIHGYCVSIGKQISFKLFLSNHKKIKGAWPWIQT